MNKWKSIHISDIGKIVTGKTPKTSVKENYGGNIPFLTPSDDLSNKYAPNTNKKITVLGLEEVKNCLLPPNSVCVSCIGSDLGKVVMLREHSVTNQQFNSIIPNDEFCPDYIYYLMTIVGKELNFIGKTSTAVPIVNKSSFSNTEVLVPSLPIQQKIANILSSLDDKIEVNRRINEQLEELAGALFKSWFVDFEPFKDGEFVDSELGMIPKGWKVGTLSDIGDVVGGATPSKSKSEYYTDNGISWITPKDLSINKDKFISKGEIDITELGYSKCSAKMMPRGSVLFSSRAPIGYIAIAKNELCTNQGFKSIVPQLAGTAFIYYYLKNNVSNIESMASGSTFKEASGALMKSLNVIVPESNILQDFEEKVCSIFDKQESLEEEIHHLTTLRDTLLPKLMSGEIDVNEVEI